MRQIIADCWTLDLPEEWQAEHDEETVIVSDEDGISAIELTAIRKNDGEVEPEELAEFSEDLNQRDLPRKEAALGDFAGYVYEYAEGGDWCRDWFLCCQDVFLLVSYTCEQENRNLDDAAVDVILDTINYLPDEVAENL